MLPSYFDYIFVHLRQKVRLRPELRLKFCPLLDQTRPEPELDPKSPARLTTLVTTTELQLELNHIKIEAI